MINRKICFVAVLLAMTAASLSFAKPKHKLSTEKLVIEKADGTFAAVEAEIAIKQEERNYGFMNRKNIPDGTGMLFVFERDQVLRFWMKNTPHPLSIAYIDSTGAIRDILDMTPFSEKDVSSSRSVRYALEVPQGWYERAGVSVGDKVYVEGSKTLRSRFDK